MTYQIISERKIRNPGQIKGPEDVFPIVKRYGRAKQEHFIVVTLNAAHMPVSVCITGIGTVSHTLIHPRETFIKAIRDMAVAVIICHNHPSGSVMPSGQDLEITSQLYEAGKILGIRLIDHLIISKTVFTSLRRDGYFSRWEKPEEILCADGDDHRQCAENTKSCPYPDYSIGEHKV
jgi:DNA repair protein RadC